MEAGARYHRQPGNAAGSPPCRRTGKGERVSANTHNLERLLRYASLTSHRLPDLFPQDTDQEKRLFQLLQRAYIEPRYKADYKISQQDLLLLTERVEKLLEMLQGYAKC